ncbi:MAG: YkgJ family cysteine cluster protein [Acidobacteria bacterium]|nr:YkgJ family cysteine cluster protein [Acidobacteriota bacterium]
MTERPTSRSGVRARLFGHEIVTDPDEASRLGTQRDDENMRFRTWLKVHCDLDGDELDDLVHETADEVWAHIDCQQCGHCCRVSEVLVDEADIARLAERFAISAPEFSRRHLRVIDGETLLPTQPCPFLSQNSCSVYEDRPKDCCGFPFLDREDFRGRLMQFVESATFCPAVYNTMEVLKRKLGWRPRVRQRRR